MDIILTSFVHATILQFALLIYGIHLAFGYLLIELISFHIAGYVKEVSSLTEFFPGYTRLHVLCVISILSVSFIITSCLFICFVCRGGKYSEDDAKVVMVQILYVVAFCHLQGVVHRDLKPEVDGFS